MEPTERLKKLPPYLFAEIDRRKRELLAKGRDVIDLGVGDPDIPTPDFIIDTLANEARDPANHRYALDAGMPVFRQTISWWFENRFRVKLDPDKEILPLIGSKEGIGHFPLALINPGDLALVPDPSYPVYRSATWFAGGEPYTLPLLESNAFLPDLKSLDPSVLKRAKMLYLNYPNNPTAAVAPKEFLKEVVEFAYANQILIVQDAAYSEMAYDGYKPLSILEIDGAREVAVEFHSLSKTFNMTGWRVGFAAGSQQAIALLAKVKANMDSGIFQAIQLAAAGALQDGQEALDENIKIYQKRRDLLWQGFRDLGWEFKSPKATFYCWIPVPAGYSSSELALTFLEDMNLVVTPGNGFGANGEGYFRISLTVPDDRIQEALARIKKSHKHLHTRA
ncbi:LL-diaminopimelate aminotransferase [Omnitrophica bacterium]|nr:LL-diaminopimelate aminotransferase [Candidatus Omnitrophota bacterium]